MITEVKKPYAAKDVEKILHPTVKSWFFSKFKAFSLPQRYGVVEIHSRNNILISAPTGATKTLTGFLSILNELIDSADKGILEDRVYAVYVSPLRALSEDIKFNLQQPLKQMEEIAGRDLGIRVATRTGDTETKDRAKMLKHPPHILITTPESLAIMLSSYKFREKLRNVQWLIVDEIHALAENKRGTHFSVTMERLNRLSPSMTRVGLSATIAPLEEIAQYLVGYKDGKPADCKIVNVQFIKDLDLKVVSPMQKLVDMKHDNMHESLYQLLHNMISEHKTTLIFTNTRSATERVVHNLKDMFPEHYHDQNIGAHHGSLSKEHRHDIEKRLREGSMKVGVCSTSLELGIDIGFIDLVVCLSSPKSVARALQRIGRAGHQLHSTTKGRIIVQDRDDLVECAVLLKNAVEKKIDRIHIPTNALDVLAQHIYGIAIDDQIHVNDCYEMLKRTYCYSMLNRSDFIQVIEYLAGRYISLEDRYIYAKIWYDEETQMIGRKGKMARVLYMTNIGTIPDQVSVLVKIGEQVVGTIEESFLEKLRSGDVFVLGGNTYQFKYGRGMTAQVISSGNRKPTVPAWFSEMLPLSFDLANDIGKLRKRMNELFCEKKSKKKILQFLHEYLYVDDNAAESIYWYFFEQFHYSQIPSNTRIVVEHFTDEHEVKHAVFHTLFGRRVNDCLSRAVAFAIARTQHRDVEIGMNDNGFFVSSKKAINVMAAFRLLKSADLDKVMHMAIDQSEILKRRFRHCAARALMILRNYKGRTKLAGRQQVSSQILINAVRRIDQQFCILKEARREVLEDLMDIENAKKIIAGVEGKTVLVDEVSLRHPSPFSFNLVAQGATDIMKIEDKMEFLERMHQVVLAKIGRKIEFDRSEIR